ncbi:MAG: hypothetical protein C0174_03965 [Thermodesulfobium narugense]|nr:MAG: hypothetical protein C0174_03965 [Thermodesulfobium narugense]
MYTDSKGRAYDNIIIERFFRSLKYENIYLINYSTIREAKDGIREYIYFYNYKKDLPTSSNHYIFPSLFFHNSIIYPIILKTLKCSAY